MFSAHAQKKQTKTKVCKTSKSKMRSKKLTWNNLMRDEILEGFKRSKEGIRVYCGDCGNNKGMRLAVVVDPMVMCYVCPWIKEILLEQDGEGCEVMIPGTKEGEREALGEFFDCLMQKDWERRKMEGKRKEIEQAARLLSSDWKDYPALLPQETSYSVSCPSDVDHAQCLSDVDIASISDQTLADNFSDQHARLVCLVCYKIFGTTEYDGFRSHVQTHKKSALKKVRLRKPQEQQEPSAEVHVCDICQSRCSSLAALKSHQRTHLERTLECGKCLKKFLTTNLYNSHVEKDICNAQKRECKTCKKVFSDMPRLRIHMRSHTGEKPFKCPEQGCGKGFSQKRSLQEHLLIHKPRSFSCELCQDRSFAQKNHLLYHLASVHSTGSSSFHACTICSKVFPFPFQLKRHSSVHVRKLESHFRKSEQQPKAKSS